MTELAVWHTKLLLSQLSVVSVWFRNTEISRWGYFLSMFLVLGEQSKGTPHLRMSVTPLVYRNIILLLVSLPWPPPQQPTHMMSGRCLLLLPLYVALKLVKSGYCVHIGRYLKQCRAAVPLNNRWLWVVWSTTALSVSNGKMTWQWPFSGEADDCIRHNKITFFLKEE